MTDTHMMTLHMNVVLNVETDRYSSYEEMRSRIYDDFYVEQLIVDNDLDVTMVQQEVVKAL